jgi:hypothetical protein
MELATQTCAPVVHARIFVLRCIRSRCVTDDFEECVERCRSTTIGFNGYGPEANALAVTAIGH